METRSASAAARAKNKENNGPDDFSNPQALDSPAHGRHLHADPELQDQDRHVGVRWLRRDAMQEIEAFKVRPGLAQMSRKTTRTMIHP